MDERIPVVNIHIGHSIIAFICAIFIISPFLHSQPKEPEELQKYNFKAISFARIPGLEEIYFGEDKDMLRLPSRNFSREMKYEGTIPTIFYGKKLNPEGVEEFYPVASTVVPKSLKNVIFVFLTTSRMEALTGRRFQVLQIDSDQTKFPGGGRHFLNLSGSEISAMIGKQNVLIPARSSKTFFPDSKSISTGRLPVQIHAKQGADWRLLSSTRWSMDTRVNTLVFIFEDPVRKRISLRGITNRVGAPPPPEEETEEE
jgi:hypothetical protein